MATLSATRVSRFGELKQVLDFFGQSCRRGAVSEKLMVSDQAASSIGWSMGTFGQTLPAINLAR
jgi:hypothetical protein